MSYNRFLELLTRKKSGALTLPEQKELSRFLEQNPEYTELTEMVDELFETPLDITREIDEAFLEQKWNAVQQKAMARPAKQTHPLRSLRPLYYWAAASVAVCIFTYFVWLQTTETIPAKTNFVSTKKGSKTNLELPDGTQVWLNADSKITYDRDFGKDAREVNLSGEAFFDVTHDGSRPFIVHTHTMDIRVLGTAFNVKAYETDDQAEATLLRGSVEVNLTGEGGRKILLKPNEKLTVREQASKDKAMPEIEIGSIRKPVNDSVAMETQWVKNRLAFNNERLDEIAKQLSRWYGLEVEVRSEELKEKKFTGIFEQEDPRQVMDALTLTGDFKYTIDQNKITIVP